nr:glutamate--cysteine ligase [Rathayibacter sp. VKM Ac-2857]
MGRARRRTRRRGDTVTSRARTFGVEEEYLLVDSATFLPAPIAPALLRSAHGAWSGSLTAELKAEQIEAVGRPQRSHADLLAGVLEGRCAADNAARSAGGRAVALATSPAAFTPHLSEDERYGRIAEHFGLTAQQQFTCGLHVHVGIDSPEEGIAVLDRIRGWLPALLALSANSPLDHGADTGYQSWRYQSWGRWPTAGPADLWQDLAHYRRVVTALTSSGALLDEGMLYFDARLSRTHPTVEVRISDVPLHPADAALIAVLVRALVETATREALAGVPPLPIPTPVLAVSSWLASRFGTTGDLIDPVSGCPVPARTMLAHLVRHVRDALEEAGDSDTVSCSLERILHRGTGAQRQREIWRSSGDPGAVIADAARLTRGEGIVASARSGS